MIQNVIFDWSGTLVNDFPYVLQAMNDIFVDHGRAAWSEDEFREKFYLPFPDFYKEYMPELPMDRLEQYYHDSFKILQEDVHLLPYAVEVLEHCRSEGIPVFLLSAIHPEHFDFQAERLGLKPYFRQAYVRVMDKRKVILQILSDHNLDPRETIYVGDMMHDLDAARHGGVQSCAVLTGYDSFKKLKRAQPDHLFKDLSGVLAFLKRRKTSKQEHFPIPTVGALIYNKKKEILMVRTHKWSDLWGMPGGKIKMNETAATAVQREILEETGLEIDSIKFVMAQDCIDPEEFFRKAHFILLCYTAKAISNEVTLNEEAHDYRWILPQQALKLHLNQPTRKLLELVCGKKKRSPKCAKR
ncbi:MAG: NUDIX domain-containing protein [Verrucomicrobiota bacterium]